MQHPKQQSILRTSRITVSLSLLLTLAIAASCFLAGCASTQEMTPLFKPVTPEANKAVIYLYRKSRFVGAANTAEIFFNNQYAGKLVSGSYCTYVTEPGPIEIKALQKVPAIFVAAAIISKLAGKQPLIEVKADPGQEYYLEFNVAGYKVKHVSKDKALGIMNGLEPAKISAE